MHSFIQIVTKKNLMKRNSTKIAKGRSSRCKQGIIQKLQKEVHDVNEQISKSSHD